MKSFDFYDTLVVRLVANPADIFLLVGERLSIPEFCAMRIAAELKARSGLGSEVTFEQIYDFVPLASDLKKRAYSLELELERSLVAPITVVSSQIHTGDLIVSDMYHDECLYRDVLKRLVPGVVPGAILISGTMGVNKASGELWKKVAANYPTHELHIGDNMRSDVHQARSNGLVAEHFGGAMLNRYEMAITKQGGDGSFIAGASRATRLSLIRGNSTKAEAAIIETFASAIGPLLHAFVNWIMRSCEEEGIRNVYFLARDGQMLFRMCSKLAAESGQDLHCHYIFASRQALHLPGCKTIDDAESWLLDNTPHLSLRIIAERACISLDVVAEAAASYITIGLEQNIPPKERFLLGRVIRDPLFVAAFMNSVNRAYESASAYYLAQGIATHEDIALVDVGWNGRLQRSLGSLLEKSGYRPRKILGLYLSLSRRLSKNIHDDLRGFLADPEHPGLAAFFFHYGKILEVALSADHPTTVGFELVDGLAQPLFGEPCSLDTQKRIALQQKSLDVFVENLSLLGRAAGRPIVAQSAVAIDNFVRFVSRPTAKDGLAFVGFPFVDGQTGNEASPIAKIIEAVDLLRPTKDLGYWPEGTLSASGLGVVAYVRRVVLRLRAKARPVKAAFYQLVRRITSVH
jgi:predicted HAD superfamily hydrolase